MLLALLHLADAGYGDVVDGYPSWAERDLHLWTNAARVDPTAFRAQYDCNMDVEFRGDEKQPKAPLYYSADLNEAARYHSQEMHETGVFSHDSPDGTSFGERVSWFYSDSGYVGENIAWNYESPWATVIEGWMCSEGHRENIMRSEYIELGTGVIDAYSTQNFGGGSADWAGPFAIGVHEPQSPTPGDTMTFYVDWFGGAPQWIRLYVDGEPRNMELLYGEDTQGVYTATLTAPEGGCHEYWFQANEGDVWALPEGGSYTFGGGCEAAWVARQQDSTANEEEPDEDEPLTDLQSRNRAGAATVTCSSSSGSVTWTLGLIGLAAFGLRRRR
jgi:MYXO-CTERM domain-containing protein